ncbi:MAG: ATP-grasp domain-containing protein [Oscillospiraceae bacterium]|nr:ATP-grasp domain-containing protein [Oscillospiraceae bacterium]
MNVLLTSVGRRAYMVKYFKEALQGKGRVFVSNSDDKTVAFYYADQSVISPLIYDEAYIPFLLDYCQTNRIDVLISLFDIDLMVLAKHKEAFAAIGTRVIVSDPGVIEVCNDKWKTYQYLKERGFHVPKTYLTLSKVMLALECGELQYPIVVKPRFGCGSIALSIAEDEMGLLYYYSRNTRAVSRTYLKYESAAEDEKIIYQECLNGQEYGVDLINDLNGTPRSVIAKKKIAMRAGETDIAELVDEPALAAEAKRLAALTGHIANMDTDWFMVNGVPYILEMNARFGGGYPFSHMGGCNLPQAIVNWCSGKDIDDACLTAEVGTVGFKELYLTKI